MFVPEWTLNETFKDPHGNVIEVLQRPLEDLQDAIENELSPFLEVPARYRITPKQENELSSDFFGKLSELTADPSGKGLSATIYPLEEPKTPLFLLTGTVTECLLTVWRVNNALDLLQVNVISSYNNIYVHAGGDTLSKLMLQDECELDQEIRKAASLLARMETYQGE